jgi:hypothetical protein
MSGPHAPEARRLRQVILRLIEGASDPTSIAAGTRKRALLGHPVLVVVATPDVDKPLVLLGRLQVEPGAWVHDATIAMAELDQATAVALVVHGAQIAVVML